jgi:hypothetical protein
LLTSSEVNQHDADRCWRCDTDGDTGGPWRHCVRRTGYHTLASHFGLKLGFTLKFALAKVNTKQHRRKYELPCRMPWVQQHCREVRHVCESKSGLSCQRMMLPTSSTKLDQTKREWRGGYIQHHYRNTAKNWSFRQPCHPMPSDSHWVEAYCWIATAPYAGRILRGTSQKCTGEREFEAVKPNVDHGSFAPLWTSCCKVCIITLIMGRNEILTHDCLEGKTNPPRPHKVRVLSSTDGTFSPVLSFPFRLEEHSFNMVAAVVLTYSD